MLNFFKKKLLEKKVNSIFLKAKEFVNQRFGDYFKASKSFDKSTQTALHRWEAYNLIALCGVISIYGMIQYNDKDFTKYTLEILMNNLDNFIDDGAQLLEDVTDFIPTNNEYTNFVKGDKCSEIEANAAIWVISMMQNGSPLNDEIDLDAAILAEIIKGTALRLSLELTN